MSVESMLKILNLCLQDSNLETISKAELRRKYLEKTGLTKLPKEDKDLFSAAVNAAYLKFVSDKTRAVNNTTILDMTANETKEDEKFTINSSSGDDASPININEDIVADQLNSEVNDVKMEASSDSDEKSLASYKSVINKPSNDFKKQREKRKLSGSSEDEIIRIKPAKRNKVLKKTRKSTDSEGEDMKKTSKVKKHFKKAIVESSDSEDEPLTVFQKKSNSLNGCLNSGNTLAHSRIQHDNVKDSKDEPLKFSALKKTSSNSTSENSSNDSEDEPLLKYKSSNHSNSEEKKIKHKQMSNRSDELRKSNEDPGHTENVSLSEYVKHNGSANLDQNLNASTKNNLNSSDKAFKIIENMSESEDESVLTSTTKKSNLVNKSYTKNSTGESENESPVKFSKKKNNFIDSDEEQMDTLTNKSDSIDSSLNSINNFSDSEDEPLYNMNDKKKNSNFSKKVKSETNMKGEVKYSSKKSVTNGKKSMKKKETIKRLIDSDDDISNKKDISSREQKKSLLSDSSEDEPLSNIAIKESKHSTGSENELLIKKKLIDSDNDDEMANEKNGKPYDAQKDSFLSDSSENEPLSNIKKETKNSSDSEDEPLNKLALKKSGNKRKSSESGSSSSVDENEEHSSKTDKMPMRKQTNESGKPGKKRLSASENKIEHLKKYVRAAGIRIQNYNKLFQNCKTMKAKCEKLMSLLEKEGLKGRPTLEKCKKLKKKIETKREIAELDLSNILKCGGGRPKRSVCSDTTNCKAENGNSTPIKKFTRLKDVFDSEESD